MDDEQLREARELRRTVLGDEYVDTASLGTDPVATELQDYLVGMAWGVWARRGPLTTRDRSLLVMAMAERAARDGEG